MTIGALAAHGGVAVKTIRFSEDEHLLPDVERSPSGYRLFGPGHLRRLRLVRAMHSLGLPLAEVRVYRARPSARRSATVPSTSPEATWNASQHWGDAPPSLRRQDPTPRR